MLKGTSTGTVTSTDGTFTINVPSSESVLQFSFMGYETLELRANVTGRMAVRLRTSAAQLEAVVVTGYQTMARERVTGAVTTVSSAALQERHAVDLLSNMEGRVAGMVIQDGEITIRGAGSLNAITQPLLVIDGMPMEGRLEDLNPYDIESYTVLKDAAATAIYGARASNGVIVISTKRAREMGRTTVDVSTNMTVFQKRNVNYADNFYLTPEQQVNMEADYWKWYFSPSNPINTVANPTAGITTTQNAINSGSAITPIRHAYFQNAQGLMSPTDVEALMNQLRKNNFAQEYADHALKNRFLQQYNVAVRSMTDRFQSNLVLNYRGDNSGIIHAGDSRFNIFYRGEYKMTNWMAIEFGVNSVIQNALESNYNINTNRSNDPFFAPAYYRLLNDDGSFTSYNHGAWGNAWTPFNDNPVFRPMHYNALQELAYNQTRTDRQNSRFQGVLKFNIIEGLTADVRMIYEANRTTQRNNIEPESYLLRLMQNTYTQRNITPVFRTVTQVIDGVTWSRQELVRTDTTYTYLLPQAGGLLASTNRKGDYWTARGQVNYNRIFQNKHAVDVFAGTEFRQTRDLGARGLLFGFDDQLQTSNPNINTQALFDLNNTTFFYPGYGARQFLFTPYIQNGTTGNLIRERFHRYASAYANLTYTYDGKYNAFGSFRRDYADLYGLDNKLRGTPLWSVGLSWNIFQEDFMRSIHQVNYLKLRGSYGVTGNIFQGVTSRMTANTALAPNTVSGLPRAEITTPANPYLTWEKTTTTNVGVDFALFTNRLRGALDFYNRKGEDIFSRKNLESTYGFTALAMNMADLYNRGVEVAINYDWFRARSRDQFGWRSSLTLARNYNKVTRSDLQATTGGQLVWPAGTTGLGAQFREGYPVHAMWSAVFAGLDSLGVKTWYADSARLRPGRPSTVDLNAVVYSGQADPKLTAGFENTLRYKGFSLSIMAVYYGGHHMRLPSGLTPMPTGTPALSGPMPSYFLRAWTPTNKDTDAPGVLQHLSSTGASTSWLDNYTDIYVVAADFFKIRNILFGYELPKQWLSKVGINNASLRFQIDNPNISWIKNDIGLDPETMGVRLSTSYIFGLNFSF